MKTKKLNKKLALNKTTISNLDVKVMERIKGMGSTVGTQYGTWEQECIDASCRQCTYDVCSIWFCSFDGCMP